MLYIFMWMVFTLCFQGNRLLFWLSFETRITTQERSYVMKKLVLFSLLLIALAVMASGSWATTDHALSFALNIAGPASAAHSDVLDTGAGSWTRVVDYSGSATLSATSAAAILTGNIPGGYIWLYEESADNVTWSNIAKLITSQSVAAAGHTDAYDSNAVSYSTSSRYFRMSYDATLTSTKPASASGSGSITIVPEPSSLVAIATGAVGLIGLIRRKRS